MKIKAYRDLQSKDELLPLFQHAFWWPFNPSEFNETIRTDPRLRNSPVGFAALSNNQVVGFVGVMDIKTRTIQRSIEMVGGVWGVVTRPSHARKGVFKTLMTKSHDYFKEQGYKFSLLYTSKILIAHTFYQRLGYRDVPAHSSAYKLIEGTTKMPRKSGKKAKVDWRRILRIYNQATEDLAGFVVRDREYIKMLETRKLIQPERTIVTDNGYVFLKTSEGVTFVQELIALTKKDMGSLVSLVEKKTEKAVIDQKIQDKNVMDTYQSRGYMILRKGYDLLMSKQLSATTFKETYNPQFYATSADFF